MNLLFPPGQIVATPLALQAVAPDVLINLIQRHLTGDWGEVGSEDWTANHRALKEGTRLLSAYRTPDGTRVWVITEWDRSLTTVLLPEEY